MSAARPETGATAEQIKAAAKRRLDAMFPPSEQTERHLGAYIEYAKVYAGYLVPPTHRIALAEHVVSAADREAIGRGLELLDAYQSYVTTIGHSEGWREFAHWQTAYARLTPEHRHRLERLRGSGGEETT